MDRDAHPDDVVRINEYETVRRQRLTKVSQMTNLYDELEKKMISCDNTELVKNLYLQLCGRFDEFETAHSNCLDLCQDLQEKETLMINFDNWEKKKKDFRVKISNWVLFSFEIDPDDKVGSRISSTSLKDKLRTARANRLKAEHKLKISEEKHNLQREKSELEIKEQLLETRSELEEAKLEEQVWQGAYDEDNDNINTNQIEGISTETAVYTRRNSFSTETDSEEKCEHTAESSQSNIRIINSDVKRLPLPRPDTWVNFDDIECSKPPAFHGMRLPPIYDAGQRQIQRTSLHSATANSQNVVQSHKEREKQFQLMKEKNKEMAAHIDAHSNIKQHVDNQLSHLKKEITEIVRVEVCKQSRDHGRFEKLATRKLENLEKHLQTEETESTERHELLSTRIGKVELKHEKFENQISSNQNQIIGLLTKFKTDMVYMKEQVKHIPTQPQDDKDFINDPNLKRKKNRNNEEKPPFY